VAISKVSEITNKELVDYLRLEYADLSDTQKTELDTLLGVSKAFIASYTGLAAEVIDTYPEFVIVIYILVQDMHNNRTLYIDENKANKVVETILGMHSINLL
jgi:hypothetical protein